MHLRLQTNNAERAPRWEYMSILHSVINHAWLPLFSSLRLMLTDVHFCIIKSRSLRWELIVRKQLKKMKPVARDGEIVIPCSTARLCEKRRPLQSKHGVIVPVDSLQNNRLYVCVGLQGTECSLNWHHFFTKPRNRYSHRYSALCPERCFPHTCWSWNFYLAFCFCMNVLLGNTDRDTYHIASYDVLLNNCRKAEVKLWRVML